MDESIYLSYDLGEEKYHDYDLGDVVDVRMSLGRVELTLEGKKKTQK